MKNKEKVFIGSVLAAAGGALWYFNTRPAIPKNAKAVRNFDVNRYLGTWYEIARFDYRFEKNMDNVLAQYSLNEEGKVKVRNSGYNYKTKKWVVANGVAKFRKEKNTATLKVSFFGPFYAGYNVIALDENYQHALVAGKNLNYLWVLSRTSHIPENIKNNYLELAKKVGYDTSRLIRVNHDKENPYARENAI